MLKEIVLHLLLRIILLFCHRLNKFGDTFRLRRPGKNAVYGYTGSSY
jgi:hypothetical protein